MQDMMHSRCYKMVPIFRSSKSEQELLKSRNWNIRWLSKGHSQILWHSWTLNRLPQEDLSRKMDPAFIQHSWILLVFTWTCLVAEEWEMISPFPYITCERDCENSSIWFFFLYCLSQRPAGKIIILKRAQRRKFMPWVTSLNQIHTALTHLTMNPSIVNTARFVYLVGPQLCNSLSLTLGFHTATGSHRSKDWNDLFQANQH